MTRWMIFLSVFFWGFAAAAYGVQPALVSSYATGTDGAYIWQTNGGETAPSLILNLKQPTSGGANNCGVLVVSESSTLSFGTPTDDRSNTWTSFGTVTGSALTLKGWYVAGLAAGTTRITIPTSGTASGWGVGLGGWFQEFQNCGGIGGTGTTSFSANNAVHNLTLSAGPTLGDAALGYFIDTSSAPAIQPSALVPGAGFTATANQVSFGKLAEMNTATTSTSVDVTYPNTTNTILGIGLVLKQGALGTGPPNGPFIDHYQVEQFPQTSSKAFTFPISGNLIVGMFSTESLHVTGMSDSACTSWSAPASSLATQPQTAQIFYGTNCTPSSSNSLTLSLSGTNTLLPGAALEFASVTNAAASPFDVASKVDIANNGQFVAADLTAGTITPTALNDIIFNQTTITWHTETSMVTDPNNHTPTALFSVNTKNDDLSFGNCGGTFNSTLDEDNGWAYYINTADVLPVTFIYRGTQTTGNCTTQQVGVGGWESATVAFKSATSGALPAAPTGLTPTVR